MVFKKRLLFWILKAYIKKWWKGIVFSFLVGLVGFFILRFAFSYYAIKFPLGKKDIIGVAGAYTVDTLPSFVLSDISRGLTTVGNDGIPKPDLARDWKIDKNGKIYTFFLKKNLLFSDQTPFTSQTISSSFADVTVQKPDPFTIIFSLKDRYAPFLVTVSRPLFKNNFVGIGKYKVKDIKINGGFVTSLTLISQSAPYAIKIYQFYPTTDALKLAFTLGEVNKIVALPNLFFTKDYPLSQFPNSVSDQKINYQQLVTVFYNTKDSVVSDRRIREALAYTYPALFENGERAYSPLSPLSFAYSKDTEHTQDFTHAKDLLTQSLKENKATSLTLTLSVLPLYLKDAKILVTNWEKIGIHTKVEIVERVPASFQIFLGNFTLSLDPDQYTLWHSDQDNNISRYDNKRIDKLLEDGRRTTDTNERKKLYESFQKHLLDDPPAAFLYFPYTYTIMRK